MNKEDFLRLAKEADVWVTGQEPYQAQLERFAELVAAAESRAWVQMINSIDLAGLRDHPNMQRLLRKDGDWYGTATGPRCSDPAASMRRAIVRLAASQQDANEVHELVYKKSED